MLVQIPFDGEVIPFIIFIFISALIATSLFIMLLKRYWERKTPVVKHLMFTVFCWSAGTLAYSLGLISWFITDDRMWIYDYSLPFGYSAILASTYFVLRFAVDLLNYPPHKIKKILKGYKVYMAIMIILFFLPQNDWGSLPPIPTFRMVNLILLNLGNIMIYSRLIHLFRNLRARIQDLFENKKLRYVVLFFNFMLSTFILMVVNEIVLMVWENPPPYGPIEYVAWALGILGLFVGYIALILPKWFREKIKSKMLVELSS